MKKILLVGSEARGHCIAETLKRSATSCDVVCFGSSDNPGIKKVTSAYEVGKLDDLGSIVVFAKAQKVDFAVISPELPLSVGVVDALEKAGMPSVGPLKKLAQLESSKSFTRDLLEEFNIFGNPKFKVFKNNEGLAEWVKEVGQFVIKPDGLTCGKGVLVQGDHFASYEEGIDRTETLIKKDGKVVLEEKLVGQEFSLISLCDGDHLLHFPAVQDHKRAFVGDEGPNTGGMGSYSMADGSLPLLQESDIKASRSINEQVAKALKKKFGMDYKGVLYGGFIAVKDGVRLIEYNARFGDPEAINILPVLKSNFVKVCEAVIDGTLDQIVPEFLEQATVCKYIVPEGYPTSAVKDKLVDISKIDTSKVKIYFASVNEKENGLYLAGSRAIALVGTDPDLYKAEEKVETEIKKITGPVFHREDIGTKELIEKRIGILRGIRG